MESADRAEPPCINWIGLVVAERVLYAVEPARHERVDYRHGVTGSGQSRRPGEMKQAGRLDEHEQLFWSLEVLFDLGQQFAQTGARSGQIFFKEQTLVRSAQGSPDFVFGSVEAEEVGWFH